jgi:hypothetical protein
LQLTESGIDHKEAKNRFMSSVWAELPSGVVLPFFDFKLQKGELQNEKGCRNYG